MQKKNTLEYVICSIDYRLHIEIIIKNLFIKFLYDGNVVYPLYGNIQMDFKHMDELIKEQFEYVVCNKKELLDGMADMKW